MTDTNNNNNNKEFWPHAGAACRCRRRLTSGFCYCCLSVTKVDLCARFRHAKEEFAGSLRDSDAARISPQRSSAREKFGSSRQVSMTAGGISLRCKLEFSIEPEQARLELHNKGRACGATAAAAATWQEGARGRGRAELVICCAFK